MCASFDERTSAALPALCTAKVYMQTGMQVTQPYTPVVNLHEHLQGSGLHKSSPLVLRGTRIDPGQLDLETARASISMVSLMPLWSTRSCYVTEIAQVGILGVEHIIIIIQDAYCLYPLMH